MNSHSIPRPAGNNAVHIVLSDRGWILERLAKELADRLPYVSYGLHPDPTARIQYYITYGCRKARVSPIEIALFTHREDDPATAALFDAAAREVDHAIAMSSTTSRLIDQLGVSSHDCITPGVDLDRFHPKLKIAVVGRTYHTGRKGEALVQSVMDIPDIEWHFTGTGWPGPAEPVEEADLPAFYRAMDYILVPALIEGGPMSVLEALASGIQVIASTVGWVPDFPHIPFRRGDADSLRQVLLSLREERMKLRASVEHMTWNRWATEHDLLFGRLLADHSGKHPGGAPALTRRVRSVALVTHGDEDTTLGGPSVRVPGSARALRSLGLDVHVSHNRSRLPDHVEMVHEFNLWLPRSAVAVAREIKQLGKPLIFSPILLDLSEAPLWQVDLLRAFRAASTPQEAELAMIHFGRRHKERLAYLPRSEPEPGYLDTVREIAELSDGLIFLSQSEQDLFGRLVGPIDTPDYLVRNPVDAALFASGDPAIFKEAYGLDDYVLCIARIEHRKNQLMLALALRDTDMPLVLVGHVADQEYLDLIKRFAGPNLKIIGRLEPGSEMLRSAISGSRVFALPSWAEGAPLAALEAAAAGANLVLSDRSGEFEYFGDHARYCDPASVASIREAVAAAWNTPLSHLASQRLVDHVQTAFSWDRYARETLAVYEDVFARAEILPLKPQVAPATRLHAPPSDRRLIVIDVTTWANNAALVSGIVRVERSVALELLAKSDVETGFVMYLSSAIGFVTIPSEVIANDALRNYVFSLKRMDPASHVKPRFGWNGDLITVGSSWMQNVEYAADLHKFAKERGLTLSVLMHDMTPALFPHWYPAGYSPVWEQNCAAVITRADRLLVYSESTRRDVTTFAESRGVDLPAIEKIRLADEIGTLDSHITEEGREARQRFRDTRFVLSVGGIHVRKNYGLLYDVWLILRESMGDACPHLVIVGGVSWNGTEVARMMREDPQVSSYIHIVHNIDDSTLDWLYEHALLTAYPSLYEGWGLPVGESLAHGKICLSSSTSSMREIAPALTDLLDPFDRVRWAAMVRHYVSSDAARARREAEVQANFKVTTWSETAADIRLALEGEKRVAQPNLYNFGEIVILSKGRAGGDYLGAGWFEREAWGCWSKSKAATIELSLVHRPTEDLILTVLAKVLKPVTVTRRYDIVVNGSIVGTWHFPARGRAGNQTQSVLVNRVLIPAKLAQAGTSLRIQFQTDQLCAVAEVSPGSPDQRKMGLGIIAFMIEPQSLSSDAPVLFSTRRDLRAVLGAGPTVDLAGALTETAHRPSAMPDRWMWDFAPFARIGSLVAGGGICAENGCLHLALGLARLRFDRPTWVEFIIDAPEATEAHPVTVVIFLNDKWIDGISLRTAEPLRHSIEVPASLLVSSDPAILCFLSSGLAAHDQGAFTISMFRLAQAVTLPIDREVRIEPGRAIRIGTATEGKAMPAHFLEDGWYRMEDEGVWSIGATGRLRFIAPAASPASDVLVLRVSRISSGLEDDIVSVLAEDGRILAELPFAPLPAGQVHQPKDIMVPLNGVRDQDNLVSLRLAVNNPAWPSLSSAHRETRRLGLRILALALYQPEPLPIARTINIDEASDTHVVFLERSKDHQSDDGQAAGARRFFLIAVGEDMIEPVLLLQCALLSNSFDLDRSVSICVSVDGGNDLVTETMPFSGVDVEISVPLPSGRLHHLIEVAVLPPADPASAIAGEDESRFDLRLLALSLHDGAQPDGEKTAPETAGLLIGRRY